MTWALTELPQLVETSPQPWLSCRGIPANGFGSPFSDSQKVRACSSSSQWGGQMPISSGVGARGASSWGPLCFSAKARLPMASPHPTMKSISGRKAARGLACCCQGAREGPGSWLRLGGRVGKRVVAPFHRLPLPWEPPFLRAASSFGWLSPWAPFPCSRHSPHSLPQTCPKRLR